MACCRDAARVSASHVRRTPLQALHAARISGRVANYQLGFALRVEAGFASARRALWRKTSTCIISKPEANTMSDIKAAAPQAQAAPDYSETLFLPRTDFP